jgi:hypothetical protein
MLCSSCAEMPLRRRREAALREKDPGWVHLLGLLCPRCGTAVPDLGFQDLFTAKVRQLELFGFAQEAPLSDSVPGLTFFRPGKPNDSPLW